MKNRKILFVLIPATILIWGIIVNNILMHIKNQNSENEYDSKVFKNHSPDPAIDTFTLMVNYPDPFLKRIVKANAKSENIDGRTDFRRKESNHIIWPEISYGGVISNTGNDLCLIRIETQNKLMRKGDDYNGLKVLRLFPDSVQIMFKQQVKYYSRKHI